MEEQMTTEGRHWTCEGDVLSFCENPFSPHPDLLDYEAEKWHTKDFTLAQVADGLDDADKGIAGFASDEDWTICRHTVYHRPNFKSPWIPLVDLSPLGGVWDARSELEPVPVNKMTRRLDVRGCNHRKAECV